MEVFKIPKKKKKKKVPYSSYAGPQDKNGDPIQFKLIQGLKCPECGSKMYMNINPTCGKCLYQNKI